MQPHFSHQNEATLFDPLEIVLAKIGLGRWVFYHTARSGGPERMGLPLDVLEGQTSPGKISTASDHVAPLDSRRTICPRRILWAYFYPTRISGVPIHSAGRGRRNRPHRRAVEIVLTEKPSKSSSRTICPPSNRPHRNRVPTPLVGEGPERRRPRPTSRAACPVDELAATGQFAPSGKERLRPQAPHVKWPLILPPSKSSSPGSGAAAGGCSTTVPGARARSACVCRSIFWKAKTAPEKTTASDQVAPVQRSLPPSTRSQGGCLDPSAQRRGPECMRLALDILEGQNLARKNLHGVGPRRAGAAELAAVDALAGGVSTTVPSAGTRSAWA
jgi:hypothetical protein